MPAQSSPANSVLHSLMFTRVCVDCLPPPQPAVTTTVVSAIGQTSFTWATPQSSSSAALFLSFGSQLEQQLSSQIAGWTCGKVDSSVPANKVAVSSGTDC